MATTLQNNTADEYIAIDGEIKMNTTNRVPFNSTSVDFYYSPSGFSLTFYNNRNHQSEKSIRFAFKSDIKTGTYNIKEGAFVGATYFEHLNEINGGHPEDYEAVEGYLIITATGEGTPERSYHVTDFKLTVKSTFSGKKRELEGNFKCRIEDVVKSPT